MTRTRDERGFTLIELMVVVLVIGILLAVAIPTFLGARSRSQDAVAKSTVMTAYKSVLGVAMAENFQDLDISPEGLAQIEPSLDYVEPKTESDGPKVVSVAADQGMGLAARSDSGTCFRFFITGDDRGDLIQRYSHDDGECTGDRALSASDKQQW